MKIKLDDIVVPENVEIVFEHFCKNCEICEPVVITHEVFSGNEKQAVINRISCNNTQICQKVRSISATEKAKDYPFT